MPSMTHSSWVMIESQASQVSPFPGPPHIRGSLLRGRAPVWTFWQIGSWRWCGCTSPLPSRPRAGTLVGLAVGWRTCRATPNVPSRRAARRTRPLRAPGGHAVEGACLGDLGPPSGGAPDDLRPVQGRSASAGSAWAAPRHVERHGLPHGGSIEPAAVTPPTWLDAAGRPRPKQACWTCGRFRASELRPHGWEPGGTLQIS